MGGRQMVLALRAVGLVVFFAWMTLDSAFVFARGFQRGRRADRLSLVVIVVVSWLGILAAISLAFAGVGVPRHGAVALQLAGFAVFALGATIRTIAIVQLGRFHAPSVAILEGHRVVDTGLYRHVRHPSYLGALIAFLGLGLELASGVSILVLLATTGSAYAYRIHVEERALLEGLGEAYAEYRRRTRRLIPGIY